MLSFTSSIFCTVLLQSMLSVCLFVKTPMQTDGVNIWQDPIPCVLDFWWAKSSFYTCWIIIAVPGTPPEFEAPYVNTSYIIYLYPSSCWLSCPCQKSTSCQVAKPLILICKVLDIFLFHQDDQLGLWKILEMNDERKICFTCTNILCQIVCR